MTDACLLPAEATEQRRSVQRKSSTLRRTHFHPAPTCRWRVHRIPQHYSPMAPSLSLEEQTNRPPASPAPKLSRLVPAEFSARVIWVRRTPPSPVLHIPRHCLV